MKVRIGSAVDGSPVSVDTASTSALVLVGDQGRGKTTVARYLARWWIVDPLRTARAFAKQSHEYADLPIEVRPLADAQSAAAAVDGRELTIFDGADNLAIATVLAHARAPGLTILTSFGEAARAFDGTGHLCVGLLGVRSGMTTRTGASTGAPESAGSFCPGQVPRTRAMASCSAGVASAADLGNPRPTRELWNAQVPIYERDLAVINSL